MSRMGTDGVFEDVFEVGLMGLALGKRRHGGGK